MPVEILILTALLGTALGIVGWVLASGSPRRAVLSNLERGANAKAASTTVRTRARGTGWSALLPSAWYERTARKLAHAGMGERFTPEKTVAAKLIGTLLAALFGAVLITRIGAGWTWLAAAGAMALAFCLPEILMYNASIKRRAEVDLQLPDMLDQMSIAVSAGLGFDAAMLRVAKAGHGVLAEEFVRTIQDLHVGKSRRSSYEDLNARVGSVPLRRFTRTIVQAETYGLGLVDVLQTQADELRDIRKQNAERKAMAIPVKVTFPLIVAILPALFIVVLGPAVVNIVTNLGRL